MTSTNSIQLKQKQVNKLVENILKAKTLMIVSIKGLPSKQFQEIKKSVRGQAKVKVAKKNILLRALKAVGRESILLLKEYVKADCAFVISNMEGYELAGILAKKKTPVFAKAGQIAVDDIEIRAGSTDLVPGPAISELGALGIRIAVEEGKISIKQSKVVVNKGEVINESVASLLQKLNIQPFTIGLEPSVIYDVENEKIYTDVKIDSEGVAEELRNAASKALGFAQKIVYYCKETVGYFLAKANVESEKLNELVPKEEIKEEKKEDSTTSKSDDTNKSNFIKDEASEKEGESEPAEQVNSPGSVEVDNINKENKGGEEDE